MFKSIDLKEKITKSRKETISKLDSSAYYSILTEEIEKERQILCNLSASKFKAQQLDLSQLDSNNIYDINNIKKIAIKYRLRFLPSKHYKNELPIEAILKIKELSKKQKSKINNFMILAPAKALELEDENADPLLFVALSKTKFYLIHQWGNDLKWYNQIKALPLKNLQTMVITIGFFCRNNCINHPNISNS
jgi:hypothetical protein